jgi:hypothetical protein
MKIEHVLEIDLDNNDTDDIIIRGLTRDGIWVPIFRLPITEEIINVYRFPLLLKIACNGQGSKLKVFSDKRTVGQDI